MGEVPLQPGGEIFIDTLRRAGAESVILAKPPNWGARRPDLCG